MKKMSYEEAASKIKHDRFSLKFRGDGRLSTWVLIDHEDNAQISAGTLEACVSAYHRRIKYLNRKEEIDRKLAALNNDPRMSGLVRDQDVNIR